MTTKTKAAFTKGQEVTILRSWDNKGTAYFINAIVHSCGKKQMVLIDAKTGEEMGRHFMPVLANEENLGKACRYEATFPRLSEEEATRIGLKMGALVISEEIAHAEACIRHYAGDEGYEAAVRKGLATLHEPRVIDRTGVK